MRFNMLLFPFNEFFNRKKFLAGFTKKLDGI